MSLTCPVCGYDKINEPKLKWSICPSCGTQFGLSDNGRTYDELRHDWICEDGAMWQDDYIQTPPYWSPVKQLLNIGYKCTPDEIRALTRGSANSINVIQLSKRPIIFIPRASSSHTLRVGKHAGPKTGASSRASIYSAA